MGTCTRSRGGWSILTEPQPTCSGWPRLSARPFCSTRRTVQWLRPGFSRWILCRRTYVHNRGRRIESSRWIRSCHRTGFRDRARRCLFLLLGIWCHRSNLESSVRMESNRARSSIFSRNSRRRNSCPRANLHSRSAWRLSDRLSSLGQKQSILPQH